MTEKPRVRRAAGGHAISSFFVFCLIAMFAVLATLLTLFGIRAYRSVYAASAANSENQIVLSYLMNKVHSCDRAGGVSLESKNGMDVLSLREPLDEGIYETRIYLMDGELREYFCEAGDEFDAELGNAIASVRSLDISFETPSLLRIDVGRDGADAISAHVALRGEVSP